MVTPSMQLIGEALAEVASISVDEALGLAGGEDTVFVDVRERAEHAAGAITGAVAAPRGFLEFIADPASPMHNPALSAGKRLVIYCASGRAVRARDQDLAGHGVRRGREPDRRLSGLDRGRRPDRITANGEAA